MIILTMISACSGQGWLCLPTFPVHPHNTNSNPSYHSFHVHPWWSATPASMPGACTLFAMYPAMPSRQREAWRAEPRRRCCFCHWINTFHWVRGVSWVSASDSLKPALVQDSGDLRGLGLTSSWLSVPAPLPTQSWFKTDTVRRLDQQPANCWFPALVPYESWFKSPVCFGDWTDSLLVVGPGPYTGLVQDWCSAGAGTKNQLIISPSPGIAPEPVQDSCMVLEWI